MDNLRELLHLSWGNWVIQLFVLCVAVVFISDTIKKTFAVFKKPVDQWTQIEENEKAIKSLEGRVDRLEERLESAVEDSIHHDEKIEYSIKQVGDKIEKMSEVAARRTVVSLRSELYKLHHDFMEQGYVTESGLHTFMEIYNIYEEAGGNDIAKRKLLPEVQQLELRRDMPD